MNAIEEYLEEYKEFDPNQTMIWTIEKTWKAKIGPWQIDFVTDCLGRFVWTVNGHWEGKKKSEQGYCHSVEDCHTAAMDFIKKCIAKKEFPI